MSSKDIYLAWSGMQDPSNFQQNFDPKFTGPLNELSVEADLTTRSDILSSKSTWVPAGRSLLYEVWDDPDPSVDLSGVVDKIEDPLGAHLGASLEQLDHDDVWLGEGVGVDPWESDAFSKTLELEVKQGADVFQDIIGDRLKPAEAKVLQSALSQMQAWAQNAVGDADLERQLGKIFGETHDASTARSLLKKIADQDFADFPEIKVLSHEQMRGANGAFSAIDDTIYLSREFLAQHSDSSDRVTAVIAEEFGHFLDDRINPVDAPGDEGEAFAKFLNPESEWTDDSVLFAEGASDHSMINNGNELIAVELSAPSYPGYLLSYQDGQSLSYDSNVEIWQRQMRDIWGFDIDVDGFYGAQSKSVATTFQTQQGLDVDGIVGQDTWEASFTTVSEPVSEALPEPVSEPISEPASVPSPTTAPTPVPDSGSSDGDYVRYVVQSGDVLWDIARDRFGQGELLTQFKDADGNFYTIEAAERLSIGDIVYIPQSIEDSSAILSPEPEPVSTGGYPGYNFQYQEGQSFSYDANVERWQQQMADLGWQLDVDGLFGSESQGVALAFQRLYSDLDNDGIVGPETWSRAFSAEAQGPNVAPAPDPVSDSGSNSTDAEYDRYVVQSGDVLWDIARERLGRGELLTQFKDADGNFYTIEAAETLNVGDIVYIPSAIDETPSAPSGLDLGPIDPNEILSNPNMNAVFISKVSSVLQQLVNEGWAPRVVSGFRSFEDQAALYNQGRSAAGNIVTNAEAGESWHNYGLAVDIALQGSNPFPDDSPFWDALGRAAVAQGLIWGGNWTSFQDRPHVEFHPGFTASQASQLKDEYASGGLGEVWDELGIAAGESTPTVIPSTPPVDIPGASGSGGRVIQIDSTGDDVEAIQQALNVLGFDAGTVDGDFGTNTDAAVRRFQSQNNLTVDGKVGVNTLAALENELLQKKDDLQNLRVQTPSFLHEFEQELGLVNAAINKLDTVSLSSSTSSGTEETGSNQDRTQDRLALIEELKQQIERLGTSQPSVTEAMRQELETLLLEAKSDYENQIEDLASGGTNSFSGYSRAGLEEQLRQIEADLVTFTDYQSQEADQPDIEIDTGNLPNLDSAQLLAELESLEREIQDWQGSDNDPILDGLVEDRNKILSELENRVDEFDPVDQSEVTAAANEISRLLHTDSQSGLTPGVDGDGEVTLEEVHSVFEVLSGLNDRESSQVLLSLSQEESNKLEQVLNNGEFAEPTGLGHTLWTPLRVLGNAIGDTVEGLGDLGDAITVYYEQIGNVTAQSLLVRGGGTPGLTSAVEYFPTPLTLEEANAEAADILAEGNAPIFSNAVRCKRGDGSSCGWLAAEIILEVAGGFVIGRVASVIGRVGRSLIIRFAVRGSDDAGEEIITSIPRELAEETIRNTDGSPIDFETWGGEFIDDGIRSPNPGPSAPSTIIKGAADVPHEVFQAKRLGAYLGGGEFEFIGKSQQGVEGKFTFIAGEVTNISLKQMHDVTSYRSLNTVIGRNATKIIDAGQNPAIFYGEPINFTAQAIADFARNGPLSQGIIQEGAFSRIILHADDGIVEITPSGVIILPPLF